jgi:hypothetical protein
MPDNGLMPFDWKRIKPRRVKLDKTMPQCAADAGLPNRQKWYQYETGQGARPAAEDAGRTSRGRWTGTSPTS